MRNLLDFLKTYHHWFIFIFLECLAFVIECRGGKDL